MAGIRRYAGGGAGELLSCGASGPGEAGEGRDGDGGVAVKFEGKLSSRNFRENSLMRHGRGCVVGVLRLYLTPLRRSVPLRMTGLGGVVGRTNHRDVDGYCDTSDMGKKTSTRAEDRKPSSGKLSHYDSAGRAKMVDVSGKTATRREAEASAFIEMSQEVLNGAAAESQGKPAGSGQICGDCGGQAHQ